MRLRNNIPDNQQGFVLVGVLCMMVLLAVTAATLNRQSGLQARRAANQTVVAQAYLGEVAAVEHAVWSLMQNPTWRTAAGGRTTRSKASLTTARCWTPALSAVPA